MVAKTKTSLKTNSLNLRNAKEKIKKLNDALKYVEDHKEEKMIRLYGNFDTFEKDAVKRLRKYLSSEEAIAQFSSWTEQEVPPANGDWEKTKRSIEKAFDIRLHKTLQLWLEKDRLMARAEWFLHEELMRFFEVPDHLKSLPDDNEGDSPEINSPFRMKENSSYGGLVSGGFYALMAVGAFFLSPVGSLAVRVGVTAIPAFLSAIGLSVEGIERLEARWQKIEFEENRKAFMSKHSKDVLLFVRETERVPETFVKLQLKRVKQYLSEVRSDLHKLIPAERKELSKFENKKHSLEKVQNAHKRICEEGCRLRGLHAELGIKEMCPMIQISREALKWNDCFSSRIGSGAFGDVFEGKMQITQTESKTVALKVCKKELDDKNASEIMDEIEMLR